LVTDCDLRSWVPSLIPKRRSHKTKVSITAYVRAKGTVCRRCWPAHTISCCRGHHRANDFGNRMPSGQGDVNYPRRHASVLHPEPAIADQLDVRSDTDATTTTLELTR
jgi:hypothetical protein